MLATAKRQHGCRNPKRLHRATFVGGINPGLPQIEDEPRVLQFSRGNRQNPFGAAGAAGVQRLVGLFKNEGGTMIALITALAAMAAGPIALDNGAIRVEVDPELFAVRFVGGPGGENFVESLYVPSEVRAGKAWADAGGIPTDLVPCEGRDAALRRGPAEVIEHTAHSVVLLGPLSETLYVRLKKTVEIDPREPSARYTVTVIATEPQPQTFAICNTVRVPPETRLRIERADGVLKVLAGAETVEAAAETSPAGWAISVPPAERLEGVVLGAFVPKVTHENDYGAWTREIVSMPADESDVPREATFLCFLDAVSVNYWAVLQGPRVEVRPSSPAVFVERWTVRKRGP